MKEKWSSSWRLGIDSLTALCANVSCSAIFIWWWRGKWNIRTWEEKKKGPGSGYNPQTMCVLKERMTSMAQHWGVTWPRIMPLSRREEKSLISFWEKVSNKAGFWLTYQAKSKYIKKKNTILPYEGGHFESVWHYKRHFAFQEVNMDSTHVNICIWIFRLLCRW